MASRRDLESLIAIKKREIEKEKTILGLSPPPEPDTTIKTRKESPTTDPPAPSAKKVIFLPETSHLDHNGTSNITHNTVGHAKNDEDRTGGIPADLERYIRRYIGLPGMLKAGEFSPNNPLVREAAPAPRDAFPGLGEYELRANTLRRCRQSEYRKILDLQAQQKREARAQEEKECREREEKERERERELLERDFQYKPTHYESHPRTHRQASYNMQIRQNQLETADAAVQVTGAGRSRSVAVQTDATRLSSPPSAITRAERELSPRTVADSTDERPIKPAAWVEDAGRRRSYGDFDERNTYMPSIFDAEAIHRRNLKAEKEAAERRRYYQQELKSQIQEQQRIREERKSREKMLEQAEMRRLEQQLRMLRGAKDCEIAAGRQAARQMKESATEFEKKRTTLQKEIEEERKSLFRVSSEQPMNYQQRNINTSKSDICASKLPLYYPKPRERKDKPFSMNIPETSIFSPNYDVDNYLRKNLNPSKESLRLETDKYSPEIHTKEKEKRYSFAPEYEKNDSNIVVEKALVHQPPSNINDKGVDKNKLDNQKPTYEPSFLRKDIQELIVKDKEDIPVLRHSPKAAIPDNETKTKVNTDAMSIVENKWNVPVVQKNIARSLSNGDGKNVSILTQLGSIRRQLQMEQLRLDQLVKDGA